METVRSWRRTPTDKHGARPLDGATIKRKLWGSVRIINPTYPKRLRPGYYVCNTRKPRQGSGHWVVIWICKRGKYGEFFYSYGLPPHEYGLEGFLERSVKRKYLYNDVQLQGLTSYTCGHHCIMYCVMSFGGVRMVNYVDMFDKRNLDENDRKAYDFVRNLRRLPSIKRQRRRRRRQ